jgi:trehalose/maltose hydrolase-like predicted phosphorylase
MWQSVVHGFAGLVVTGPDDPALSVAPCLPSGWEEIRIRVRWRGKRLRLACRSDAVHVECDSPVTVVVHGEPRRVEPPGRWVH